MPPRRILRRDYKPKYPVWTNLSDSLSTIAVFFTVLASLVAGSVFLQSCVYIWRIEVALGFSAVNYVDFSDYVQTLPTELGTAAAIVASGVVIYTLFCWGLLRLFQHRFPFTEFQAFGRFLIAKW
jgi:hypothetical protein